MKKHIVLGLIYWVVMIGLGFVIESSFVFIGAGLKGLNIVVLIILKTAYSRALFMASSS